MQIGITFDQKLATKRLDLEFLTIHHPFIMTELQHFQRSSRGICSKIQIQSSEEIDPGEYLFFVIPVIIEDAVSGEIKTVFFKKMLYSLASGESIRESMVESFC